MAVYAAHTAFQIGSGWVFEGLIYSGLIGCASLACFARAIQMPRERLAWAVHGSWPGRLDGRRRSTGPWSSTTRTRCRFPRLADGLYLLFYAATYVALVLLVRGRMKSFRSSQWLDGAIAASAVARVRRGGRLPADRRRDRGRPDDDRGEPLLPPPGPASAEPGGGELRPVGLAPGPRLAAARRSAWASWRSATASTSSRQRRAPTWRAGSSTRSGRRRRCSWAPPPGSPCAPRRVARLEGWRVARDPGGRAASSRSGC